MTSTLKYVGFNICSKMPRLATVGFFLLAMITVYLLTQHWSYMMTIINSTPTPQPITRVDIENIQTAKISVPFKMRSSQLDKDFENIRNFAKRVLGYEEFPDQCKPKLGFHQARKLPKFDLMKYGPYKFLPNFRNPCWLEPHSSELLCLPYFYLVGFPKCGSTDLYARIIQHPDVIKIPKEIQWVRHMRIQGETENYTKSYGNWLIKRSTDITRSIAGDGNPSTAWDTHRWTDLPGNENCTEPRVLNADYIRHLNPNVKIVMILRNPTNRLYSGYLYFGSHTSQEAFHDLVERNINIFNNCVKERSLRSCAYNINIFKGLRPYVGLYSVFLEDWLLRFPREQILVVRLEDLARNVIGVMKTVFEFLGLALPSDAVMHQITIMKKQNMLCAEKKRVGPMWNKTRILLDNFYRPFNKRLAAILRDSRFTWEDS